MTSVSKLYSIICIISIFLFSFLPDLSIVTQLIICSPLIILLGLPHGAIDNVLFLKKRKTNPFIFYSVYLLMVGFNVILWIYYPEVAYILFILISAYHFGQSQFIHYLKKTQFFHNVLYFFWGLALLSSMIFFQNSEIISINNSYTEFLALTPLQDKSAMKLLFIASTVISLISLLVLQIQRTISSKTLFREILITALLIVSFWMLPLLISFTLYFVILHSYKVLEEEFHYLKRLNLVKGFRGFVGILAPLSIISFIGIFIFYFGIEKGILQISFGYLLLIVISSITFPHIFVMEKFYKKS